MRRLAVSVPALLALACHLLASGPAQAEVRSLQLVQTEPGFASGRLEPGLSLAPGGLRATAGGVFASAPLDAGMTFSAIGPHWQGAPGAEVALSVSPDGVRWGRFVDVPAEGTIEETREDGEPSPFAGDTVGALVFVPEGSRFVRYRVRLSGAPPEEGRLRRIAFHVIDPGESAPAEGCTRREPAEGSAAAVVEPDGGEAFATAVPAPPLLLPELVPRAEKPSLSRRAAWGARPPKAGYTTTLAGHVGVHHTATVEDFTPATWEGCAARVRAIQAYHMDTNGWNDLGYAYLICKHGDVFQGREDDDDTTDVQGAHDGFNRESTGISVMGYFHPPVDQRPTEAQVAALVDLVGWIADLRGIDPTGRSLYAAFGAAVDNVYGHREVKATDCPGDHLFALKELVRASALERILFMPL